MNARERVRAALDFQQPDRVPIYNQFWPEFEEAWRLEKGLGRDARIEDTYHVDVDRVIPDETPFPSQSQVLERTDGVMLVRDGWGAVQRQRASAKFYETVAVALPDKRDLPRLAFESPTLASRFLDRSRVDALRERRFVFVKIGGPYLRTSNLRGTTQWLIDLAEDTEFAGELAMKVSDHITAVGLEAVRRYGLYDMVALFDDMACNRGPMFSPRTFRRVFLPCYVRMCTAIRRVGVSKIMLHSDGNIEPVLDMLVDAGIDAINPVEPKAGMDVVPLRRRYGRRLALIGGLDNAYVLPRGNRDEINAHVNHVLEAGQEGGLILAAHSIGSDVSVATYDYLDRLMVARGRYPLQLR
jgi:uroporphyrinogen decarboxylase